MENIQFLSKKSEKSNSMKRLFFLLFCSFLFFNCSRIGFNEEIRDSSQIIDYKFDSIISEECGENRELCATGNKEGENNPFFQASKENKPGHLTEYFEISNRNNLEILLVIDASDSMDDNLRETGKNMEALLSYIQDKNWRIAFITADHGDHNTNKISSEQWKDYNGSLPRFGKLMNLEKNGVILNQFILSHDMEEYEQIFKDTITRENSSDCKHPPYCHGVNEQPLRSLKAAISRYQTNSKHKQFFQPNTDTVVLIITDEDERRPDSHNATTAEQVIQTYNKVFAGQKKRLFGFSISIQDKECYEDEKGWFSGADYGRIVSRLAELTGGRNISLCSSDYGRELKDISKITRSLVQSLTLQKIFYIPDTVQVSLSPHQPEISWKLYGRKLVFSGDIKPGTQIKVSYRYEE